MQAPITILVISSVKEKRHGMGWELQGGAWVPLAGRWEDFFHSRLVPFFFPLLYFLPTIATWPFPCPSHFSHAFLSLLSWVGRLGPIFQNVLPLKNQSWMTSVCLQTWGLPSWHNPGQPSQVVPSALLYSLSLC